MESGLARFGRKGSPRRRPCSASAAPAWTRVNIVIVMVWCPDPDKLETAFVLSPDPRHQEDMIPIVLGGTPVSRFWVIGGVAATMNGYPWVVQLKLVMAELLKIMPPEVTRPPGGEEPQPFHGPHCGGTVINSRLVFLNIDIIYVTRLKRPYRAVHA